MNGFLIFVLLSLIALTLEVVLIFINDSMSAECKKNEQNQLNYKFELAKNVLEIMVLLISLYK